MNYLCIRPQNLSGWNIKTPETVKEKKLKNRRNKTAQEAVYVQPDQTEFEEPSKKSESTLKDKV